MYELGLRIYKEFNWVNKKQVTRKIDQEILRNNQEQITMTKYFKVSI